MTFYTVKQVSKLSGVTIRTLHHYDEIGLLKPGERSEAGYRFYGRPELLRLQQILFYKELDFSLLEIREMLDAPGFDLIQSLTFHRERLLKQSERLQQLLTTINKTINELQNQKQMMTDQELYEGFKEGQTYRKEAAERWGKKTIVESENRLKSLGKEGWNKLKAEGEAITQRLADLMAQDPASPAVQETIMIHYNYMNNFFDVTEEAYRGLGKMYVEDERFRANYEKYRPGLAAFILQAIEIYCNNGMKM